MRGGELTDELTWASSPVSPPKAKHTGSESVALAALKCEEILLPQSPKRGDYVCEHLT